MEGLPRALTDLVGGRFIVVVVGGGVDGVACRPALVDDRLGLERSVQLVLETLRTRSLSCFGVGQSFLLSRRLFSRLQLGQLSSLVLVSARMADFELGDGVGVVVVGNEGKPCRNSIASGSKFLGRKT